MIDWYCTVLPPLTITFLGTRGEIEARTRLHAMHSSLLIEHGRVRVMVDCGADWVGRIAALKPDAIALTHAHKDHAAGLKGGAPCPVYGTAETLAALRSWRIARHITIAAGIPFQIDKIRFEAFAVEHSIRAPAVGYRISSARACFFYCPDLVAIHDRHAALSGVRAYIGDGASLVRPIVRMRGHARIGHASIREQIHWCHEEGVARAVFTHCGSGIVKADPVQVESRLAELARSTGVQVSIAHDGMRLVLK